MDMYQKIIEAADAVTPKLILRRRDFHKYAEPGWQEMRTSSIIARQLTELGYEVLVGEQVCLRSARMGVPAEAVLENAYQRALEQGADEEFVKATRGGMTGVIGILRCGEGPTVALRFDIDALGVYESEDEDHFPAAEGFASVNSGVMHACGHDGHAVSGLGVAQVLMQIKEQLHGTVKLIFQPSEEGVRGAKSIVEKGHLDDVDFFLGAHTTAADAEGSDVTPGSTGALATGKYDVVFTGRAAHAGGEPHLGRNALQAAAAAVMSLYGIPRHGAGASRINVGKLVAGSGRNVIADEAFMELEVRGVSTEINDYMCHHAMQILEHTAAMYECTVEIREMGGAEAMFCTPELMERVAKISAEKLGLKVSENLLEDMGGSEDVSYMTNRVQKNGGQATFIRVRSPQKAGAHNRKYDFDESYIPKSIKIFCATVYDLMK